MNSPLHDATPAAPISWMPQGGGKMGDRLRAFDWTSTSLGLPDQWPQSLRVAVGVCMNSRFPMFVWWGPDLINIYNDAYAPVLGQRHPDALGKPAREIWADIWPDIGEDVDGVIRRGEPIYKERVRFVMERNGYPEVTYFTYSHSAIPDGRGGIGGLFQVCSDETAKVLAENRDRFLLSLDDAIRPLTDPDEITLTAARLLGKHLAVDRCAYADIEPDEDTMNLTGNYTAAPGIRSIVGRLTFTDFGAEVLRLMREDKPYVVHDVDTHVPPVGDPAAYRATQIQAVICVPLHKDGRFVAAMAVHQATPRRWTPDEVDLVRHVAARCWESIERARVARTLGISEERRRLALESAELGWWHIDPATMELTSDERFRAIFGIAGDRAGYEEALSRIHADDRQRVRDSVAAAFRPDDPIPHAVEHRIVHPDGSVRWVFAKGRATFTGEGRDRRPTSFDGTIADITARKAAEDHARTILESITDAFFALDYDWRFAYVNPQAERLLGRRPGDLIGKSIWDAYPGLVGSEFERAYRRTMDERVAVSVTSHYPDHDRWYEVHVYPSPDGISVYFRDVSERKLAEEQERKLAREALSAAEANAKFRTFFEQGTYFAGVMALDGTVIEANRLCLDACGFTREQVIGRKFWECGWWSPSPELAAIVRDASARAAAGHTFRREMDYFIADGSRRVVALTLAPVTDDAGRVLFVAPSGVDITDKQRMADERERLLEAERAARAEAERVGRMKDEFLATLSHELRTPLNAILGWSQILAASGGGRDADDLAEGLRTIERNARAQTQIIDDLLDMSRIISGKVRLDVQRMDLPSIVHGAVDTARPAAEAKGIRLHAVLDPTAGVVAGDPNRMQQVFWNLLSNAVKFTPKGGRIQVVLERTESQLRVSVSDTGIGIKPHFLPYVFDRFRQADATTTRAHGGLGLGLAIVKQLVELHGGVIAATSPGEGRGATFVVTLPASIVHTSPERASPSNAGRGGAPDPVPPRERGSMKGVKVLVVDDEPDARALVKRLLEDCDAVVTMAASAAEAIERLLADRPDVLVSDIGMPKEDGYSLIRRVRALGPDRGGNTPAVALTAYARSEDRTRSVLAGYQMHAAKPIEPSELVAMVASLAGRSWDRGNPGQLAEQSS